MKERKSGDATGMAGEFFVMERLYRLGHQPALTVGRAKSIDILVKSKANRLYEVSVKAIRGGGKWPVDVGDVSQRKRLVYVFLLYRDFENVETEPDAYIIPAMRVNALKRKWFEQDAVYCSNEEDRRKLKKYRNSWRFFV